jgi:two-component system chemotaxis response regulator CheB
MSAASPNKRIRVLVVDDSRLMATQITKILQEDSEIEVAGVAADGVEALEMIESVKPDVITLDVEMPRMNGITTLKHLMVKHSIPTVMISALTHEGTRTTFDAFRYGAIDVIAKPSRRHDENLAGQKSDIISKVRRAADIRTGSSRYLRMPAVSTPVRLAAHGGAVDATTRIISVGAGTGGYYSLLRVIPYLSQDFQDVLVAIILAKTRFVAPFIDYLAEHSAIPVKGSQDLQSPRRGACYICSGEDSAVVCEKDGGGVRFEVTEHTSGMGEGAVDTLFKSVGSTVGKMAAGIILSGPGSDGAEGIAAIRKRGGVGVVQDITNCMDPSMPLAVLEKGPVDKILPDYLMADFIAGLHQG